MPQVIDTAGKVVAELPVPAGLTGDFGDTAHPIFRAVHRELANPRAGTASTKKRDDVAGGGRKPWRQKGTGRARQGSIRSPQWRHGGVVFGPQPRSYVEDLNKKERRLAFAAALANRMAGDAVTVLDVTGFALTKTAAFATLLFGDVKKAKDAEHTLVVYGIDEPVGVALERVGRNLTRVGLTHVGALDVKDILRYKRLIFTRLAYDALLARFGDAVKGGA
ncbi:MAG: 50S ribosomal protein L4 [Vulcanimicrobiaceae bacterium]